MVNSIVFVNRSLHATLINPKYNHFIIFFFIMHIHGKARKRQAADLVFLWD